MWGAVYREQISFVRRSCRQARSALPRVSDDVIAILSDVRDVLRLLLARQTVVDVSARIAPY